MTARQLNLPIYDVPDPPPQGGNQHQVARKPAWPEPHRAANGYQPAQHLQEALQTCHQQLQQDGRIRASAAATLLNTLVTLKIEFETQSQAHNRLFLQPPSQQAKSAAETLQETLRQKGLPPIDAPDQLVEHCLLQLSLTDITDTHPLLLERARRQLDQDLLDGNMGRVATLPQVADCMVNMLRPSPEQRVLDLACGAGTCLSLLNAHLSLTWPEEQHRGQRLTGLELYGPLAAAAQQALQVHQAPQAVIHQTNTLSPDFASLVEPGSYDLVISNLPLGVKTNAAKSGAANLQQFDILAGRPGGKNAKAQVDTEVLFVERVQQALKPGTGEAALIVSDGLLSNQTMLFAREWIMKHFALNAVISLPHRESKTSIILLRRLAAGEEMPGSHRILMGIVENTGEQRGKNTFTTTVQSEGGRQRQLRQHSDLIDYQLTQQQDPLTGDWLDLALHPVPGDNILTNWLQFRQNPDSLADNDQP